MLVCRGKSVPLPTNAVRAYRISTIIDDTAEGLLLARTVKAY